MKAYTDYPFIELGDIAYVPAKIRECDALFYDGNKYCTILVEGKIQEIKAGYIYQEYGRFGEVPAINPEDLPITK